MVLLFFRKKKKQILPRIKTYGVVHFTKSDARLANNGIPKEVQKLRCRVNYHALRFVPPIEQLAKKIVSILKERGPFLSLHLRYEMDMIAFSGCNEGCNKEEIDELTKLRYKSITTNSNSGVHISVHPFCTFFRLRILKHCLCVI